MPPLSLSFPGSPPSVHLPLNGHIRVNSRLDQLNQKRHLAAEDFNILPELCSIRTGSAAWRGAPWGVSLWQSFSGFSGQGVFQLMRLFS